MQPPVAALLDGGARLHLQHGPIDLIIGADAATEGARHAAFQAAALRFNTVLDGLVQGLPQHRSRLHPRTPAPQDTVARRMYDAARPYCRDRFVTPMIAVAGAVADTVLQAMTDAVPLRRAYVNNGGDIAVHLARDARFRIAMASAAGATLGRVSFDATAGIGGVATSGTRGRSLSLGIADSVTVLAATAAEADAAATLIANAVDLPDHAGITRTPANRLHPDSDLGSRRVVTAVPALTAAQCRTALAAGEAEARRMSAQGRIAGAALFLQDQSLTLGHGFGHSIEKSDIAYA